ncbi:alpha/beta hydrolase [Streptomyces sp. NHF165]|uniref:alpha/beta fold hydrolase n=1 Tax=Streptomyces sp. NHF165 TaxID=2175864 RepID=UPI00132E8430|nr:alpha/beta hydrolase [Streptomyces sp. NHF165]QHF97617.1 alpha/beta hydrolase [Streptomyces sp. NHF165]
MNDPYADDLVWTPVRYAHNGPVALAHDRLDGAHGTPLLLVMGLGTNRFWWPAALCRALAEAGFAVARYDQRDAGGSTRMPDTSVRNPFKALFGRRGESYTSEDMTDDAVAVLDALGWDRAYVFGHSLGGVIAQRIALRHPDRVRGVVSSSALSSDTAGLRVLRHLRPGLPLRLARARFPEGREGEVEAALAVRRGVASPGYPFDEEAARAWARAQADAGPRDTRAQSRQIGAQWHGPPLRALRRPLLVLHGEQDQLLRLSAARATARAVPGSRLVTFPGVGHDLPAPLAPVVAREVRALADAADTADTAEAAEAGQATGVGDAGGAAGVAGAADPVDAAGAADTAGAADAEGVAGAEGAVGAEGAAGAGR